MASKNVIIDLTKGEKLDKSNYDMWHQKIQHLLNEREVLDTLTTLMICLEEGTTAQYRCDMEKYDKWVWRDRCENYTMLSSMHNNLIGESEVSPITL
ncbi:hypothetical protein CsSME_00030473 [Camellia sinensis var. sinensis]